MRPKERIPVVLENIPMKEFIISLGIFATEEEVDSLLPNIDLEVLREYWEENPDLRLTQVLVSSGIIPNSPGFWFYIEETEWMIKNSTVEAREILFWTAAFDDSMNRLPSPVVRSISELDTSHIQAILEGQFTNSKMYTKAFEDELLLRKIPDEHLYSCAECGSESVTIEKREDGRFLCDDCFNDLDFYDS